MVDRDLLLRKLADIEVFVQQLSEYRTLTVPQYQGDWKTQRIVERTLQMAVEACTDVANHMIADRRLEVPSTYADAFEILTRAGLLDRELGEVMVRMVGFRNVVVHEYTRVDAEVVVRILRHHVTDLQRFQEAAKKWM